MNKEVLNQVECLFVGQLNAKHERRAIGEWIVEKGLDSSYLDDLPGLEVGEMFIWSPQWLKLFERVKIEPKWTLDSSATPKLGQRPSVELHSGTMAELEELLAKIRSTLEVREQTQPPGTSQGRAVRVERVEVPVLRDGEIERMEALVQQLSAAGQSLAKVAGGLQESSASVAGALQRARHASKPSAASGQAPGSTAVGKAQSLSKAEAAMLAVVAYHDPRPLSSSEVAVQAVYSPASSTIRNALSALRGKGLVQGDSSSITIAPAGRSVAVDLPPPATGRALTELWSAKLGRAPRTMLAIFVQQHPDQLDKSSVAAMAGYSPSASTVRNALSALRRAGLIFGRSNSMVANEILVH